MPWNIRQGTSQCSGYGVFKEGTDELEGCHTTRAAAQRQMAALYASESKTIKMMAPGTFAEGDFAMAMVDEELHAGQIIHIMREGMLGVEGSKMNVVATPENPAILIRVFEQHEDGYWKETPYFVGFDAMSGMKIDKLPMKSEYFVDGGIEKSVRVGAMVSWNSSGGRAKGKVKRIIRDGSYNVPDSDFTITGTPDNPAVVIEIYRDDKPTGRMVGHRMDTLRATKSLEGGVLRKMYSVAQNHPGCQGGWAVVDEDGKLEGCFASKDQADAYAAKENMEEEYEDRIDELKQEMKMKEDVMQQKSIWSSLNPRGIVHRPEVSLFKRDYSSESRRRMAASGQAMPDGSFPIANRTDLMNAIRSVGRASNYEQAKRHIMRRARALGATDMLPKDWK